MTGAKTIWRRVGELLKLKRAIHYMKERADSFVVIGLIWSVLIGAITALWVSSG